jgi:Omp85 superfamily domain
LRYGFADSRLMARVAAVRDAPSGRLTVAASRDLADIDVFARGLSLGNSLNSMLAGHDDGAYLLAQGGRVTFETSAGLATELTLGAIVEDQQSVGSEARALLPQIFGATGYYPPNPAIRAGFATGVSARVDHGAFGTRWMLSGDALHVAGRAAVRLAGELRLTSLAGGWVSARIKGGVASGVDSLPQLALRAGGVNSVRGYDFGLEQGDAMWATQLDVRRPGRGAVKVVLFVDAGQAGQLASFGDAEFLSSAGVGVSFLGGFIRTNLSYPLTYQEGHGVRFDLVFGGLR